MQPCIMLNLNTKKAIIGTGSTKEKFKEKGEIVKLKDVERKSTLRIKTGVG